MQTLVLNGNQPHDKVSWRKAIGYLMSGKAELLQTHDTTVYAISKASFTPAKYGKLSKWFTEGVDKNGREILYLKAPAVVVLLKYIGFRPAKVAFSRKLVKERDSWECQYEGCKTTEWLLSKHGTKRLPKELATIDHVHPKHLGGKLTWENAVTACLDCNSKRKGGKTIQEAGLRLRSVPKEPLWMTVKSWHFKRAEKAYQLYSEG